MPGALTMLLRSCQEIQADQNGPLECVFTFISFKDYSRSSPTLRMSHSMFVSSILARANGQSCSSARQEFSSTTYKPETDKGLLGWLCMETMNTGPFSPKVFPKHSTHTAGCPYFRVVFSMHLGKVDHVVESKNSRGSLTQVFDWINTVLYRVKINLVCITSVHVLPQNK